MSIYDIMNGVTRNI